ncbi:MAG: YbaB/EbfC family nucleoid-associated protein [Dehalococcoidia bacterium]
MNRQMRRQGGSGGGAGGMGGMDALLKQAQQMQEQLLKAQEEFANQSIEATAGGGMVTVVIKGNQKVESVTIDPEAVDPDDVEMLQDLIVAAMNEALEKLQTQQNEMMGPLAGGLKLPGM